MNKYEQLVDAMIKLIIDAELRGDVPCGLTYKITPEYYQVIKEFNADDPAHPWQLTPSKPETVFFSNK